MKMDFSLALFLGLCVILLISWIFREINCIHQTVRCSLPGPQGVPILGNIFPLLKSYNNPFRQYLDWAKGYGSFYKIKVGTQLAAVICDADNFAQVFGKTGNKLNYRVRGNVLSLAMGNKGIATSDGKVWEDHRRFATKAFRDLKIGRSSTENLIFTEVMRFVERVKLKCQTEKVSHNEWYGGAESDLNICIFSVLWNFVGGQQSKSEAFFEDENLRKILVGTRSQLRAAEQSGGWNFFFILQILWIIAANPLQLLPSYIRRVLFAKKELNREKLRRKQEDDLKPNDNLVQLYLQEVESRAEQTALSELNLEVFMSDFIVAGVESLASSIRWTLLYLTNNPKCLEKLRKELDTFLQNSTLSALSSYSSRSELPYLEAVITESLRICPVVHTIVHVTHEDFTIANHFIPKDTWVMGNIWAVHHDEKIFPNSERFEPERFLETNETGCGSRLKKDLVEKCFSFSTGPRRCLGEKLSRMELHAFIALIVHQFDMQINPKKLHKFTLRPDVSLSLIPKDDFLMFKPRVPR